MQVDRTGTKANVLTTIPQTYTGLGSPGVVAAGGEVHLDRPSLEGAFHIDESIQVGEGAPVEPGITIRMLSGAALPEGLVGDPGSGNLDKDTGSAPD